MFYRFATYIPILSASLKSRVAVVTCWVRGGLVNGSDVVPAEALFNVLNYPLLIKFIRMETGIEHPKVGRRPEAWQYDGQSPRSSCIPT